MDINNNKSLEDLEGELWKDIPNCEGWYQISNMGRVKSLFRVVNKSNGKKITFKSKILSPNKHNKTNYLSVLLRVFDKYKRISIHRLVGMSFLEFINDKLEINHIDYNKSNNKFDNLEWVNKSENSSHAFKNKQKTSIYIGVFKLRNNKFRSYICYNKKKIHFGTFPTELEAYQARKKYQLENNINNKYS